MSDKVKYVYFNKYMREVAERYDLDKYRQELNEMSREDILKERQKLRKEMQETNAEMVAIKDLEIREQNKEIIKEIIELYDSIDLDSEFDIKAIKIMELVDEKIKEFGKFLLGVQDRKGVFLCALCLVQEKYNDPNSFLGFETIIYGYDILRLKAGSFYQCDDCKKKIDQNGIAD